MEGWIKVHRKILDSHVFGNPELFKLFMLCLLRANHKKRYVHINGVSNPVEVTPGQFVTGREALHRQYYSMPLNDEKTPRTIWRWMEKLEKRGALSIKSANKYSIITIVNWDKYQKTNSDVQQNDQQPSSSCPTDDQQVSTDKNVKNAQNAKNELARLEEFEFNIPKELQNVAGFEDKYRRWWKYLISVRDQTLHEYVVEEEFEFLVDCQRKGHAPLKVISQSIRNKNKSLYQLRAQTMHTNGGAKKLFTYTEVQKLRQEGTYTEDDFKIRHDKKDGRGNPLRELITNGKESKN